MGRHSSGRTSWLRLVGVDAEVKFRKEPPLAARRGHAGSGTFFDQETP
jgi:hypothetical protein